MNPRPGEGLLWSQLGLSLLTAGVSGLLIYLLWGHLGLPAAPGAPYWPQLAGGGKLRAFAALGLPAVALGPTAVLAIMVRLLPPGYEDLARRMRLLDGVTYLVLPLGVLVVVLWTLLGNGLLAFGLCYLGLLTLKALILVQLLWRGFLSPRARAEGGYGPRQKWAVFLVTAVVLAAGAAWTAQVAPPLAGEAEMLRQAQVLALGGQAPDAGLYPRLAASLAALGGRLAIMAAQAALGGLLAVLLLAWLERAGAAPGPAACAAGLALSAAPVLFAIQMAGPLALAMTLIAAGVLLLTRPLGWGGSLALSLICLVLGLLDTIMVAPALALAAWGLGRALAGRTLAWLPMGLSALCLLAMALWCLGLLPAGWPAPWQALIQAWPSQGPGHRLARTLAVAWTAPVFLLALGGMPSSLRRYPRPALVALTVGLAYADWLVLGGAPLGPVGPGLPGGPLAAVLPLAALFMLPALTALNRPWLRVMAGFPAVLGLSFAWLLCLAPSLRFASAAGGGTLAAAVDDRLGINLQALSPLAPPPSAAPFWWLGLMLLSAVLLAVHIWRAGKKPLPTALSWSVNEMMTLALCCGVFLAALLTAGAWLAPGA